MNSIEWKEEYVRLLDQTKLPSQIAYIDCYDWVSVAKAIQCLAVRGAPAIGVAAGYAMVLGGKEWYRKNNTASVENFKQAMTELGKELDKARPTAVNLHWAITRMNEVLKTGHDDTIPALLKKWEQEARLIQEEDLTLNHAMAVHGADLFQNATRPLRILTHCNAGALATAGLGTALGVVRELHNRGQIEQVYADETRPLLQGARLTAFELAEDHIPTTLICDNMAGWIMKTKQIDAVIVGADRITAKGDTANKIGTYSVALLAKAHHIPMYIAAPSSTFDLTLQEGSEIPIEERHKEEITHIQGVQTAPLDIAVCNPAFDVTPAEYITAIITEKGVITPVCEENIRRIIEGGPRS